MSLQVGDLVQRPRFPKDFIFSVEKIFDGYALIQNQKLPIYTIEPLRELVKVERINLRQNNQKKMKQKKGVFVFLEKYFADEFLSK